MTTATETKCACEACLCTVDTSTAIAKEGQYYCSEACANGHPEGASCSRSDCTCNQ
ncbi:MAG: metallothionein [Cyanobacteria bacterium J06636_16]